MKYSRGPTKIYLLSIAKNILELFSRYLIIFMDSSNLKMSK
ncbi:hypothetical protein MG5_03139 [Candida albicans P57072]|nr:hypothetical protein MG5_03139 [Candida albicans P57072]KHC36236.1 hypothetical protein MGQ_03108 [Candida albicans P76067]RLP64342.1 hypothetical protein L150_03086 [Candida albicans Ca529L]